MSAQFYKRRRFLQNAALSSTGSVASLAHSQKAISANPLVPIHNRPKSGEAGLSVNFSVKVFQHNGYSNL
jgi:hypothetical protein